MWPLLVLGALALCVAIFFGARYVLRAIDEGRPGWGDPRGKGVYCPGAKGHLGARGWPGEEEPK